MKIMVAGPRRPQETKALWWARVEVIEWDHDHGHFHDHRLARSLFVSRSPEEVSIKIGSSPATKHKVLLPGTVIALCRVERVKVGLAEDTELHVWEENDQHYQTLLLLQSTPKDWVQGNAPNQRLGLLNDIDDDGEIKRAFTCTGGEIDLDRMRERTAENWEDFFTGFVDDPQHLSVHSSGLSFEGSVKFVWEKKTEKAARARFIVTQPFAAPGTLHMALDRERIQAEDRTGDSLSAFARAFRNFAHLLRHESSSAPAPNVPARQRWFGLDLTNKTGVPQFRWELDTKTAPLGPPIRLARGEIQLLVSDQPPGEQDVQPRSLLTAAPEVKVEKKTATQLVLSFADGKPTVQAPGKTPTRFTLEAAGAPLKETVTLAGIVSAYDPLTTATLLRQQYQLPVPDSAEGEINPALLWGFVPLENGWAQVPFLNLTSQLYFDALQEREIKAPARQTQPLLSGAATFGNDAPEVFKPEDGEQPWNITLLNGIGYTGSWKFDRASDADPWLLKTTQLEVFEPEVALNGFLWLGTQTPSTADALPSLDNWLSGIQMIPLQTLQPGERFPSPFHLRFATISFKNDFKEESEGAKRKFARPLLQNWDFSYESNQDKIEKKAGEDKPQGEPDYSILGTLLLYGIWGLKPKFNAQGIWAKLTDDERKFFDRKMETFWNSLPLVWQRHPKLPAIQALPLTQNKLPPNYPSTSRQLAPFELRVKSDAGKKLPIPDAWTFGVKSNAGASAWPQLDGAKPAATDWKTFKYLWLASLGVPGLVHDPQSNDKLASDPDKFLPLQYLYGLPYTDEPNALAQPPKQEKPNHLKTPTQDVTAEKPILPLTREAYVAFWKDLSEKALLSRPDADEALHKDGTKTVVKGMIEPYKWHADVSLKSEEGYPGAISFAGEGGTMELSGKDALRGIEKDFSALPDGRSLTIGSGGSPTFSITANSMAAHGSKGQQRDQRGLWRSASEPVAAGAPKLLKTVLKHEIDKEKEKEDDPDERDDRDVTLYSLFEPLSLTIENGKAWDFWFRDVPLDVAKGLFNRPYSNRDTPSALSKHAQDVNDPAATSSRYAHLSGYEWRLAGAKGEAKGERAPLTLFGFDFYPLTLEKVEFTSDDVRAVEIIGRLQLPDNKKIELPELGNAVRIRFEGANSNSLRLKKINSVRDKDDPMGIYGIWPLGDSKNSFAPTLRLRNLEYEAADEGTPPSEFKVTLSLDFYHFNARWEVPASEPITFQPNQQDISIEPIKFDQDFFKSSGDKHVAFSAVFVKLKGLKPEKVEATLSFNWGEEGGKKGTALVAEAVTSLLGKEPGDAAITAKVGRTGKDGLFKLNVSANTSLVEGAIQFEFSGFDKEEPSAVENLHLLPGMRLSKKEEVKGFAVMAFKISEDETTKRPQLRFRYGGLEAIIPCLWGESLQTPGDDKLKSVYGSSAGRVYAGYTLNSGGGKSATAASASWQSSLLLNGFIEVKNLISWPAPTEGLPPGLPDRVRFNIGKHEIGDIVADDVNNLERIAGFLKSRPEVRLSIEGHADNVGSSSACLETSKRRADKVRDELIKKLKAAGHDENLLKKRILAVGFGATLPADTNIPGVGNVNNRRVEIRPAPFFLPAANPSSGKKPALDHTRHTIRVLFNQHVVPEDILTGGSGQLLFNFDSRKAWQFLAVVEHQLVDIKMGPGGRIPVKMEKDRRFTVVQEVRLAHPTKFADFLKVFRDKDYKTVNLTKGENEVHPPVSFNSNKTATGYQHKKLLDLLFKQRDGKDEIERLDEILIVEASASYWVLPDARQGSFTNLQYLPQVTQRAILSVPGDFAMRPTTSPAQVQLEKDWVLLSMPFLGRLQAEEKDRLISLVKPQDSYLQIDPVFFIAVAREPSSAALPEVPRALSSWEDGVSREVRVSYFEQSRFRRLKRLDPVTLEENWFRLHHPLDEAGRDGAGNVDDTIGRLSSVMASLPEDSPGRLSRSAMLARLFDEFRNALPPAAPEEGKLSAASSGEESGATFEIATGEDFVWRRNNLFIIQGYSDLQDELRHYGFYFAGMQINSSDLPVEDQQPTRFAAATALPANLIVPGKGGAPQSNPEPVSFAVSPYLGIDFLDYSDIKKGNDEAVAAKEDLLLVFAELLCLNPAGDGLSLVASQVWPAERLTQAGTTNDPKAPDKIIKLWGQETARRLAADSPIAVLRVRKVHEVGQHNVTINYEFQTIRQTPMGAVSTKAARPIRLGLTLLRFAEGQFGGSLIPLEAIKHFELAPPQVYGVQPLYLEPAAAMAKVPEEVRTHRDFRAWTCGLSALRFSVRLTHGDVGVAAPELNGKASHLWWNVTSHHVQFVVPGADNRLLPDKFRANSIRSLLPTVPNLPLPEVKLTEEEPGVGDPRLSRWQPVLPGAFNYFVTGARAGVPFVFRHFLLRQEMRAGASGSAALASGAVPIQHRMPRPVSLPENKPDTAPGVKLSFEKMVEYLQRAALQTWPSLAGLAQALSDQDNYSPATLKSSDAPSDNALIIVGETDAHGLEVDLFSPHGGLLPQQETAEFVFKLKARPQPDPQLGPQPDPLKPWLTPDPPKLELLVEGRRLAFTALDEPNAEGGYIFRPTGASGDPAKSAALMREFLTGLPHGAELLLQMKVTPPKVAIKGYNQTLAFPLRLVLPNRSRLPLQPAFIQFEDPEYNRRLTSQSARAHLDIRYESGTTQKSIGLTLATDRLEYNPTSELLLAVSRSDGQAPELKEYSVTLKKISAGGEAQILKVKDVFEKADHTESNALSELKTFDLGEFTNPPLIPGDSLLISLNIEIRGQPTDSLLELRVDIVSQPVTPTPDAGYALLRRKKSDDKVVECVRFAWAALPQRIELINPDDLNTGLVRRRAVYQWLDTVRSGEKWEHEIQKITPFGSTHFPAALLK